MRAGCARVLLFRVFNSANREKGLATYTSFIGLSLLIPLLFREHCVAPFGIVSCHSCSLRVSVELPDTTAIGPN
jgi:hypothetical protein